MCFSFWHGIQPKGCFRNTSDHPIRVNTLKSRFVFDGSEYQVYTQFNNWQHESTGAWQNLVSSVSVASASTRLTMGGTPFKVLWNEQTHRGVALHVIPNGAWEIKATRTGARSKHTNVVVDLGLSDYGMDVELQPGQSMEMPEILCYEVRNQLDCDCWKTAVARILSDTKAVTTFQYSDVSLNKIVVQLFTHETMQQTFRVYPVVDEAKSYRTADGTALTGCQIADEGIGITTETWFDNWHEMFQITLEAI